MISIDETARVSVLADIEPSVRGSHVCIGSHTVIDSFVKIKPAGGLGNIDIGQHSTINSGCVLYSGNGIRIGNHVLIAANCTLAAVNHAFRDKGILISQQGFGEDRGGITIEDDVWIGANCVLLDGTILRRGCVVGAGSVVRGELPAYSICYGSPAMVMGERE